MRRLLILGGAVLLAGVVQAEGLPSDPDELRKLGQLYASAMFRDAYAARCKERAEPDHVQHLDRLLEERYGVGVEALEEHLSDDGVDLRHSAEEQLQAFLRAVGGCTEARARGFGEQLAGRFRSQQQALFGGGLALQPSEAGTADDAGPAEGE